MQRLTVILPAAGASSRFGRNKLLEPLAGRSVIERSVSAFLQRCDVAEILIATNDPNPLRNALGEQSADARVRFIPGGGCRAQSVRSALSVSKAEVEWIAVHDAARPLVSGTLIDRVFLAAQQHGAAAPAVPVALTIKQAIGPLPAPVQRTVPRADLFAMQTPQIARRDDLQHAFDHCPLPLDQVTDDLQLLELIGQATWLVPGDEMNLKLTTPTDLAIAEQWVR